MHAGNLQMDKGKKKIQQDMEETTKMGYQTKEEKKIFEKDFKKGNERSNFTNSAYVTNSPLENINHAPGGTPTK